MIRYLLILALPLTIPCRSFRVAPEARPPGEEAFCLARSSAPLATATRARAGPRRRWREAPLPSLLRTPWRRPCGATLRECGKPWTPRRSKGRRSTTDRQAAAPILYAYLSGGSDRQNPVGAALGGQKVFEAKLCASCHEQFDTGRAEPGRQGGSVLAFSMGLALVAARRECSPAWSRQTSMAGLSAQEMADIIAYLKHTK